MTSWRIYADADPWYDKATYDEAAQDEAVRDEAVRDEAARDEAARDEAVRMSELTDRLLKSSNRRIA